MALQYSSGQKQMKQGRQVLEKKEKNNEKQRKPGTS